MTVPPFSYHIAHTLLTRSPLHAYLEATGDLETAPSDTLDEGAIRHAYLLEGETAFAFTEAADWRSKVAREARAAARADGKLPLLAHKWPAVVAWAEAVRRQVAVYDPVPFTSAGVAEVSLFCELDGVACRATPDWRAHDNRVVWDLKTVTGSAHPAVFARTLWDKGYHLQAALYRRAVQRVYDVTPDFVFLVTEIDPPYAVSAVSLDPAAEAFADQQLDDALRIWTQCRDADYWPGYRTQIAYAEPPPWVMAQAADRAYYQEASV